MESCPGIKEKSGNGVGWEAGERGQFL